MVISIAGENLSQPLLKRANSEYNTDSLNKAQIKPKANTEQVILLRVLIFYKILASSTLGITQVTPLL